MGPIRHFKTRWLSVLASVVFLIGCELTPEQEAIIDGFFDGDQDAPPEVDNPTPDPSCFLETFVQPEAEITKKVDILFITDTSSSLDPEKQGVANGLSSFVEALPEGVDYNVAVLLAHSSASSKAGKLYAAENNQAVLKSSEMTLDKIIKKLKLNLSNQPSDNETDGGEGGLLAMNYILDPDKLAKAKSQDFFREDAALAVIFISDENDVCYPGNVVDPQGSEKSAFKKYCTRTAPASDLSGTMIAAHQETINAEVTLQKINWLQNGRPFLVGAVVYSNLATVPHDGENEYGYGYMDIVNLDHGPSVDLANGNYNAGLSQIGELVTLKLNLVFDFTLSHTDIDTSTLGVKVDGESTDFDYNATLNSVHVPEPGGPQSTVHINYCMKDDNSGGDDGGGDDGGGDDGGGDNGGDGGPIGGV